MTTALLVAYFFPPIGGAGVQRTLKFVRYLPAHGVRPVVVAGPESADMRWAPQDATLTDQVPPELPVYRPSQPAVLRQSRVRRLLGRTTGVDQWWSDALVEPLERAIAEQRPDVLYVTLAPYAALEPVLEAGERHGLPVVADLRDPWAIGLVEVRPSRWHRSHERARMGRLLARCAHVVMNTPEAAAAAREAFPAIDPSRFEVITNGYDEEDFEDRSPREPDGRFRILHSGSLFAGFGLAHRRRRVLRGLLGGLACPVDLLGRSHWYLLEALRRLAGDGVDVGAIDLHLLGRLSPEDRALSDAPDVPLRPEQIHAPGYVDHDTTVRAQVHADLLFLPMHGLPKGRRSLTAPGKTFEYLASGRPILAAVPEGDARDWVLEASAGEVVYPDDVEGMARALERFLESGPAPTRRLSPAVTRFQRRSLTRRLAEAFERVR